MSPARRFDRTIALTAGLAFVLLLLALVGPAAATAAPVGDDSSVVRFQDYTLPQGQTVQSVVVIHGNAVIGGTVRHSVVVVGGDATIESTAVVGAAQTAQTSSVVVVGGHLTIVPGAAVHGTTTQVTGFRIGGAARALLSGVAVRPIGVIVGWWQLLFLPIVALVVVALFPRPVRRVAERAHTHFWPSLGWGLVGMIVAAVVLVVLAITIVGLIVAVPVGVIALPLALLFCFVCVAQLLGGLVLSSSERYRDSAIATAVTGAVLLSLVSLVPVLGGLALLVATAAGAGAALMLLNEWRQARHQTPAMAGQPTAPPSGPAPGPGPQYPPPSPSWPQAPPPGGPGPQGWGMTGTTAGGWPPPPGWGPQPQGWTPPPPGWGSPPQGWTSPQGWAPPATEPPSDPPGTATTAPDPPPTD